MPSPLVIAHRGAAQHAPENTLAAFEHAIALGADGIELDVHCTADGAVVVHHDAVPQAVPGEPALAWRPFGALTLAEVRRLRVGESHNIPTLDETLELTGDRLAVYCELKGAGVVERAAPLLARHRGPCAMHSFDHRAVRRAAELAPKVPRGILLSSRLVDTARALRDAHAMTLWPHREHVDAGLVAELHAIGVNLIVWTANDPLDVRRLLTLGVDGVCTDHVDTTRDVIASTFGGAGA